MERKIFFEKASPRPSSVRSMSSRLLLAIFALYCVTAHAEIVIIALRVDLYPDEAYAGLVRLSPTDSSGDPVIIIPEIEFTFPNEMQRFVIDLDDGEYMFFLNDEFGDGGLAGSIYTLNGTQIQSFSFVEASGYTFTLPLPNTALSCNSTVPSGWTCDPCRYNDTYCDCNCGVTDLDCTSSCPIVTNSPSLPGIFASTTGSDVSGCGELISSPCATLSFAMARTIDVHASDARVYLLPGTFEISTPIPLNQSLDVVGLEDRAFVSIDILQMNSSAWELGSASLLSISNITLRGARRESNWLNSTDADNDDVSDKDSVLEGGGVFHVNGGNLTLTDCLLQDNAAAFGGCIFAENGSIINLHNVPLLNNHATEMGGAIFLRDESLLNITASEITLSNQNSAAIEGGLFYSSSKSTVLIEGTFLQFNQSTGGNVGGFGRTVDEGSYVYLKDIHISHGSSGYAGGGIYSNNGDCTFSNVHFDSLSSYLTGGAIQLSTFTNANFSECTFSYCVSTAYAGGAMGIEFSSFANISHCVFDSNSAAFRGGALYIYDQGSILVSHSTFSHNQAYISGPINIFGGAVTFSRTIPSTFEHCVFDNNFSLNGGAIATEVTDIQIGNCTFQSNMANNKGGGLYAILGATVTLSDTNGASSFYHNTAALDAGGGIYTSDFSFVTLEGTHFEGNTAPVGGGVNLSVGSTGFITGTSFIDNNASSGGGGGGMAGSDCTLHLSDATFVNNSASDGGGLLLSNVNEGSIALSEFSGNNASSGNGGGVMATRTSIPLSNCTFTSNIASNGGSIFSSSSTFTLSNSTITNGTAITYGGGLFVMSLPITAKNCDFNQNIATTGAGAYIFNMLSPCVFQDTSWTLNTAGLTGGALHVNAANVTLFSTLSNATSFALNYAGSSGGAISSEVSHITTSASDEIYGWSIIVTNNTAALGDGGAFFLSDSSISIANTLFENNVEERGSGGAVAISGIPLLSEGVVENAVEIENCSFIANQASNHGGALFVTEGASILLGGCNFSSNHALNGSGGAIAHENLEGEILEFDHAPAHLMFKTESVPSWFEGNSAGMDGGGIYVSGVSEFFVYQVMFSGNYVAGNGGAMSVVFSQQMHFDTVELNYNNATNGGGIHLLDLLEVSLRRTNFTGNAARDGGGAVFGEDPLRDTSGVAGWWTLTPFENGSDWIIMQENTASYGNTLASSATHLDTTFYSPTLDSTLLLPDVSDSTQSGTWFKYDEALGSYVWHTTTKRALSYHIIVAVLDLFNQTVVSTNALELSRSEFVVSSLHPEVEGLVSPPLLTGHTINPISNGIATFDDLGIDSEAGHNYHLEFHTRNADSVALTIFVAFNEESLDDASVNTLRSLTALFLFIALALLLWTGLYATHPVLVASSPVFCYAVLSGLTLSLSSMLTFFSTVPPTTEVCKMASAQFSLGFVLGYGALLFKTWRVWRIFCNPLLERRILPNRMLLLRLASICLIDLGLLAAWYSTNPPQSTYVSSIDLGTRHRACTIDYSPPLILLMTAKVTLVGIGVFLAFKIRNVESRFNESKWIGYSLYNVGIAIVLLVPIIISFGKSHSNWMQVHWLLAVAVYIVTILSIFILFLPKVYQVHFTVQKAEPRFSVRGSLQSLGVLKGAL